MQKKRVRPELGKVRDSICQNVIVASYERKKKRRTGLFFPQTKIVSIEISEKRGRKKKEKERIPSANEFTSELMSASSIGTKSALI